MRNIFVLFLMLTSSAISAQDNVIYSDSPSVNITIRVQSANNQSAQTIKPGEKIAGTSDKTKLSFGLKNGSVNTGKSNSLPIKIGLTDTNVNRTTNPAEVVQVQEKEEITNIPNYYSVIIGVDKYQFASADLVNLHKPIKDAITLKDILVSKYFFSPANSIFLQNPTRADILRAFEELAKKVTQNDNVLIFYAGHGYWDERLKVGYWLPSDSKTDDKSSWIANSTIRDYIAGIQSRHTLLISDACFSGSIFKTREVNSEINEYGISKVYQLPSRKAMTSGTLTTVPDESKFMQYLVKRLSENTSKYLTTRQLFFSVETAVLNNTSTVPQLGVIQETGDEGGDFIFIKRN